MLLRTVYDMTLAWPCTKTLYSHYGSIARVGSCRKSTITVGRRNAGALGSAFGGYRIEFEELPYALQLLSPINARLHLCGAPVVSHG